MFFGLRPYYTYNAGNKIWRLLLSDSMKLLVEERDEKKKNVVFKLIDIKAGKTVIDDIRFEENQWLGVDQLTDQYIFFHTYIKPDLPHHTGIFLYDINQEKLVLRDDAKIFGFFYKNRLYYSSKGTFERDYFMRFLDGGNLSEEKKIEEEEFNRIQEEKGRDELSADYLFPEVINPSDEALLRGLKENRIAIEKTEGNIEHIRFSDLLIFTFHYKTGIDYFNCELIIFDIKKNKTLSRQVLGENIKSLFFDSFFMKESYLFVLKGKTQIIVFNIQA